jgi:hypothetical protein
MISEQYVHDKSNGYQSSFLLTKQLFPFFGIFIKSCQTILVRAAIGPPARQLLLFINTYPFLPPDEAMKLPFFLFSTTGTTGTDHGH